MKKIKLSTIGVLALALGMSTGLAEPLAIGKKVPAVKSTDTEGKEFDVTEHLKMGATLVFFFPKANTGG
jgi:hypothetical protein